MPVRAQLLDRRRSKGSIRCCTHHEPAAPPGDLSHHRCRTAVRVTDLVVPGELILVEDEDPRPFRTVVALGSTHVWGQTGTTDVTSGRARCFHSPPLVQAHPIASGAARRSSWLAWACS